MNKIDEEATRYAFGEAFQELFKRNKRVVGVSGDLFMLFGLREFAKENRERCFNIGVAEQNLIGVSAGLATTRKIPFAMTIAAFASLKAVDPIKMCVAYAETNVKIVVSHGGIFVGKNGASHQDITDFAVFRAMPNMTIITPSDGVLTRKAVPAIADYEGPVYFRLGRPPVPAIHNENTNFTIGKAITLRNGSDISIIAAGIMVHQAIKASEILKKEGIEARVIEIHTIKPIDKEVIIQAAEETGAIVTAEDHSINAGLGAGVAEILVENCPIPMKRVGVLDVFSESGSDEDLRKKYKMTAEDIVAATKNVLERKNR